MRVILNLALIHIIFWASSTSADNPVKIDSPGAAGLLGCQMRSTSPPPINVRLYSLKTSSGKSFYRKSVSNTMFVCYGDASNTRIIPAKNIKECAEATVADGRQMFQWKDGACTGYKDGIPKDATCEMNETEVLYSLGDVVNGLESISLSLSRGVSSIVAQWTKCHPDFPSRVAKFQLTWNGDKIPLNGSTFKHKLGKHLSLCDTDLSGSPDNLLTVTLEAFDNNNTPVMEPVNKTLSDPGMDGKRYKLQSGNCLYFWQSTASYDKLEYHCHQNFHGTMFIQYKDGDFATFQTDLAAANLCE